jgi:hypothetical protein
MWRLLSGLAVAHTAAQDPASMATAMAGQVAGIMATKAEKMVEPWGNSVKNTWENTWWIYIDIHFIYIYVFLCIVYNIYR